MMDLFQNLWARGGDAAQAVPTDMSQIKVQPQALEPASSISAANSQLDFNKAPQGGGTDWASLGLMAASQLAGSMGKQQKPMQPGPSAPQYRGGPAPEKFTSEQISGRNIAAMQQPQVGGLLGR